MSILWLLAGGALSLGLLAFLAAVGARAALFWMPGRSWRGAPPPLDESERALREELRRDLQVLAVDIGERNIALRLENLRRAAEWIEGELRAAGHEVRREEYVADRERVWNVVAEVVGGQGRGAARSEAIPNDNVLVVGAHYDTVPGSPGANDNGSAVVAALALARRWRPGGALRPGRTLRFVFFVNEEQPYAHTTQMGSWVHANGCAERGEKIAGMICLETIGCFLREPGSQRYPKPLNWFFPSTGDFLAFVSNRQSARFLRRAVRAFRRRGRVASEGVAAPESIRDIGRSDHWSFWQFDYPAIMVTDTANFRYVHYHEESDTPDKIAWDDYARAVSGVAAMLEELAR
jgi:hypothetical protein